MMEATEGAWKGVSENNEGVMARRERKQGALGAQLLPGTRAGAHDHTTQLIVGYRSVAHRVDNATMLFQKLCVGIIESIVGACDQHAFAPIDESFAEPSRILKVQ
ncbi:hypothetical protein KSP40_PGU008595 [Platanthera guangdongensis]|uniref:Uncharacterized protein n=1 Tax=Platanthera guangdongensis TaxID=2320717 RepID=A0ABR2LEE9_9ASPA